jgi:hypothetical protein
VLSRSAVCRECVEQVKPTRTEPDHVHANNNDKEQRMSIGAVGGLTAAASAISALARPENAEVRGAPDHDADSDNGSANVVSHVSAVSSADAHLSTVHIDVKA